MKYSIIACILTLSMGILAPHRLLALEPTDILVRLPPPTADVGEGAVGLDPVTADPHPIQLVNHDALPLDTLWSDTHVGYDNGFLIASRHPQNLDAEQFAFRLQINGWGQLRHTLFDSHGPNADINQFQLKRGRLLFTGHAFTPDFSYSIQLDGRSSSGDMVRLLDYFLTFDVGNHSLGLERGELQMRAGKYKMPFTLARRLSGRQFEFADRSMASTFFDVNRSFAWGLRGERPGPVPWDWEVAVFNGLVTGGAETGSSGNLDNNFAYSAQMVAYPTGDWGSSQLADFEIHDCLATRLSTGYASSAINRRGSTEFNALRVVNSGAEFSSVLPNAVDEYRVQLFSVGASLKFRGWSATYEHYFRHISDYQGAAVPTINDDGFWLQVGKFAIPEKLQLLARWSRVVGDSGTLGADYQSSSEIAGAAAWYFREQHAKIVTDITYVDSAPVDSAALDLDPQDRGWLFRTQMQFAF